MSDWQELCCALLSFFTRGTSERAPIRELLSDPGALHFCNLLIKCKEQQKMLITHSPTFLHNYSLAEEHLWTLLLEFVKPKEDKPG